MTDIIYRLTCKRRIELTKGELVRVLRELTGDQVPHDDLFVYYDALTGTLVAEFEEPTNVS